ncbi:Detected protein of unknown function [Hibiscus syriacus]|uniref:Uncharacterized protein n=1 Tax=Hibiscus syriacus TaxID=106335 RepID=A0A6A3ABV4_HIBSY|nr:uncharacterized protein LOC120131384 [Hibiscus syriacus]KAE8700635.1 Detected protein of unknown function [Hibiscus syriacus]
MPLIRSSSTAILNSWLPNSKDCSSLDPNFQALQRTRSVSFSAPSSSIDDRKHKLSIPKPRKKEGKPMMPTPHSLEVDNQAGHESDDQEEDSEPESCLIQRLFSTSGLGERVVDDGEGNEDGNVQGNDGGKFSGCGGSGFFESNTHGRDTDGTDVYYQKMIEANPGNPLLLGNYAKYLKEIRGDFARAEEYCGRAILANPYDGSILSLYADLIWKNQKDAHRAKSYFDQAVNTSPDDCFVLASYAKFLWDAEVEEEEEDGESREAAEREHIHMHPPGFNLRPPQHPSITAAS